MPPSESAAGPTWLWITAWSLQGAVLLGIEWLEIETGVARFLLSGALAALPLVGLYLVLVRRGRTSSRNPSND